MYHAIVGRIVRAGFDRLSAGDYSAALAGAAPNVHHVFAGDHPLGGERHSRDAFRQWFERLFRLFPALRFQIREVVVKGWPWRTVVAVEWEAHVTPAVGPEYVNQAAHIIHIRLGRADSTSGHLIRPRIEGLLSVSGARRVGPTRSRAGSLPSKRLLTHRLMKSCAVSCPQSTFTTAHTATVRRGRCSRCTAPLRTRP